MQIVGVLRQLWRRPLPLMVGVWIALTTQLLLLYSVNPGLPPELESRRYKAGVASTEVLVDSPSSQVVDLGQAPTPDTQGAAVDLGGLSTRARLLASLMATSPLKDRIATGAGIAPHTLFVFAPTGSTAPPPRPVSTDVRPEDRRASVMHVFVDETLPIITMRVQAPDRAAAEKLASSAVTQLETYLESVASAHSVPNARQLVVSPLGPATSATIVKGPRRLFALAAVVILMTLWCAAIVLLPRVRRTWREVAAAEALEAQRLAAAAEALEAQRLAAAAEVPPEPAGSAPYLVDPSASTPPPVPLRRVGS